MKTFKLSLGVFFAIIEIVLALKMIKAESTTDFFEKLVAFVITGGLAFWLIYSSREKEDNL